MIIDGRGISIAEIELEEGDKEYTDSLAMGITNRIRTKVRKSLRKSYRKFMKKSDIEAIEKARFQHNDDKYDDGFLYLAGDDISDIEQIFGGNDNWGESIDFSVEEILDMPTEGEVLSESILTNIDYAGQNELCKVVFPKNSETPKQDTVSSKTDDIKIYEFHGGKIPCELFCVTGKDLEFIDIDSIFDNDKMVI